MRIAVDGTMEEVLGHRGCGGVGVQGLRVAGKDKSGVGAAWKRSKPSTNSGNALHQGKRNLVAFFCGVLCRHRVPRVPLWRTLIFPR